MLTHGASYSDRSDLQGLAQFASATSLHFKVPWTNLWERFEPAYFTLLGMVIRIPTTGSYLGGAQFMIFKIQSVH